MTVSQYNDLIKRSASLTLMRKSRDISTPLPSDLRIINFCSCQYNLDYNTGIKTEPFPTSFGAKTGVYGLSLPAGVSAGLWRGTTVTAAPHRPLFLAGRSSARVGSVPAAPLAGPDYPPAARTHLRRLPPRSQTQHPRRDRAPAAPQRPFPPLSANRHPGPASRAHWPAGRHVTRGRRRPAVPGAGGRAPAASRAQRRGGRKCAAGARGRRHPNESAGGGGGGG